MVVVIACLIFFLLFLLILLLMSHFFFLINAKLNLNVTKYLTRYTYIISNIINVCVRNNYLCHWLKIVRKRARSIGTFTNRKPTIIDNHNNNNNRNKMIVKALITCVYNYIWPVIFNIKKNKNEHGSLR